MKNRLWIFALAVAAVAGALYFQLPRLGMGQLLLYNGIGLVAVASAAIGLQAFNAKNKDAWALILSGQLLFLLGDVVRFAGERITLTQRSQEVSDLLYLSMYPLVIAGLRRLIRQIQPQRDWPSLLDAGVIAVAAAAFFGALVINPYLDDPTLSPLQRIISLALPVMDIALIAIAMHLLASVRLSGPPFVLLFLALVSLLIGDFSYGIINSTGSFTSGGLTDAFWLGFYALIAAALLNPHIANPARPRGRPLDMTRRGIGLLSAAAISVPLLDTLLGNDRNRPLIMACSAAISLLVILRLATMMQVITTHERLARHEATHDALTGLPNRLLLRSYLADHGGNVLPDGRTSVREPAAPRCPDHSLALLYLDLDDFKRINDSLGHVAGDRLLIVTARRMQDAVREGDLVARLAGDEFAVLLTDIDGPEHAIEIIERLRQRLHQPVWVEGVVVKPTVSIGGSVRRCSDVDELDDLLRDADSAMYRAKSDGKAGYRLSERPSPSGAGNG